jgi:hypothetical protein
MMETKLEFVGFTELNPEILKLIDMQVDDLLLRDWKVIERKFEGNSYFVMLEREGDKSNLDDLKARNEAIARELARIEAGEEPDFELPQKLNRIRA